MRYPTAFAQWLRAADFALGPVYEVAIVGDAQDQATQALNQTIWGRYQPRLIAAISAYPPEAGAPALLEDRSLLKEQPTAYVCQGFICRQPVNTPQEMLVQLELGT